MSTLEKVLAAVVIIEALGWTEGLWLPYASKVPGVSEVVSTWHSLIGQAKSQVSGIASGSSY